MNSDYHTLPPARFCAPSPKIKGIDRRQVMEEKFDHLHGLELLLEKVRINRSMLQLDKKNMIAGNAKLAEAMLQDEARIQAKIYELRDELTNR